MKIITISREFGSGGHTIGKAVAERMGVSFYDSQLISKVAKQSGLSEEFIRDNEEYASHANSFLYQIAMSAAGSYGYPSIYQKLYEAQTHVIEELAEKEACVIMGRCSDYILRGRTDCLHVFIHADNAHRAKHVLERYGAAFTLLSEIQNEVHRFAIGYHRQQRKKRAISSTLTAIGAYATTTTSRWTADCSGRKNVWS